MIKSEGVSRAALVELNIRPRPGIKASKTDRVIRFTDDKSLGAIVGLVRLEFGSMGTNSTLLGDLCYSLLSMEMVANVMFQCMWCHLCYN